MQLLFRYILILVYFAIFQSAAFSQQYTTPPASAVRTPAEWEEQQTLLVAWRSYTPILTEIIRAARTECKVVVACDNQNTLNSARNLLDTALTDTSNVQLAVLPNNTVWIRDYGPNAVYSNNVDSLLLVDWMYNRHNRAKDDALPVNFGTLTGLPVYSTTAAPYDLVNTGGNFMSDGLGTAFASNLILRNNDQLANGEGSNSNDIFGTTAHTAGSIDEVMAEFMGIDRYIKLTELPYDGIHHIDMHMKLLDEETILLGQYPEGVSDGPQIEANWLYILNQHLTSFGRPFRVVWVPMPSFGGEYPPYEGQSALYPTYANAVFVNKTVIMPKYNLPLDAAARDTLQKHLPGYNIVQIDCNSMIGAGGAIHCITKEIGADAPLHIAHPAIRYADISDPESWRARAIVRHRTGIQSAVLWYTTDLTLPWQSVAMSPDANTPDTWTALIPQQEVGVRVYYYIQATANNGKTLTRPMPAPEGYWVFPVTGNTGVTNASAPEMKAIFPNPASAITAIPLKVTAKTQADIYLVNALGQVVETLYSGLLEPGESTRFLHANRYPAGTYQVVLQTPDGRIARSVTIQ